MFPIPNTTISSTSYVPAQTWEYDAENVSGYLFCSGEPVYVRLTVGTEGQDRLLPEFFMAPGAQTLLVQDEGDPISKVEVRLANNAANNAQFWGVLATKSDPLRTFAPVNYSINPGGGFVPPVIQTPLIFQHNGVQQSVEGTADFEDSATITWTVVDDGAGSRAKISGSVTTSLGLIAQQQSTSDVLVASSVTPGVAVVSLGSVVFTNALTRITFFAHRLERTAVSNNPNAVRLVLQRDGVTIADPWGRSIAGNSGGAGLVGGSPVFLEYWDTPTAGNHTYSVSAYAGTANEWTVGGAAPGAPIVIAAYHP